MDQFGYSLTSVGKDCVLISARNDSTGSFDAGTVYLLSMSGTLITTFTNPMPTGSMWFGYSVAAMGADRVLIGTPVDNTGAPNTGIAYLFGTNGGLLTTFTNPTPQGSDNFGSSVAVVGADRILIGAPYDDANELDTGVAHLFTTNGTLLRTFYNPTPEADDWFGGVVAAMGSDQMLISAYRDDVGATNAGVVYLFGIDGTLLTTFTNPTPELDDNFGFSVAAVGAEKVLIGARLDNTVAPDSGAAYLFSTNGTLLATFNNPTPYTNDYFGRAVTSLGSDLVLIAANQDRTGGTAAGAVYLFSTNGSLLVTITNPTPKLLDSFGYSVAAVGSGQVLISAQLDDTGASDAGAAYLFTIQPFLDMRLTATNTVAVSWLSAWNGFALQHNVTGVTTAGWSNVTDTIHDDGTNRTLIVNPTAGNRFYRLARPW